MTGPSILSLFGSVVYLFVLLACSGAAVTAARYRQPPSHARTWLIFTVFFAILAASRLLSAEELLRDYLRDALRASGSYRERREFQAMVAAAILVMVASFAGILLYRWARRLRGRRNVMLLVSSVAVLALLCLIALRLISLHMVDAMLFGPLKLNWVIDLGASFVVLLAAGNYVRLVRARP